MILPTGVFRDGTSRNASDQSKVVTAVDPIVVSLSPSLKTEKYFDMKKTQCKEGLDIYKKFLTRMTRISEFLKVAEVAPKRTLALTAAAFG